MPLELLDSRLGVKHPLGDTIRMNVQYNMIDTGAQHERTARKYIRVVDGRSAAGANPSKKVSKLNLEEDERHLPSVLNISRSGSRCIGVSPHQEIEDFPLLRLPFRHAHGEEQGEQQRADSKGVDEGIHSDAGEGRRNIIPQPFLCSWGRKVGILGCVCRSGRIENGGATWLVRGYVGRGHGSGG